ncbi:MAG: iron uptake porin [Leptolyngbyaceae cyanobacterium CSU_1_3]|nr:iron uptake porin [Leptolyngbyaceae cyanobacterium CSU_1_3]
MLNNLWKSRLATPALLSATLTVSAAIVTAGAATAAEASKIESAPLQSVSLNTPVRAQAPIQLADASSVSSLEQVKTYGNEGAGDAEVGQVTSVSQLSDVRPTDWAFQALQSLVERYGCIAGYPDRTYRGNRALTRYEFAAGLNACLDRVNELIAAATADLVKKEDLATLQKLQEEFAAELATLRGRVDSLEARTTTLEKQQFSTTTKLRGEAIFSVSGALGDEKANSTASVDENTTFSDRVRLSLATSFTGKDTLLTRLQARNVPNFGTATGTNMARLSYEGGGAGNNSQIVDKLYYRFPVGPGTVTIDAVGGEFYANVPNFNPLFASDGQGSISRFGRFNPIYRQGGSATGSGAGVTLNLPLSQALTVSLGYLADDGSDPSGARGLFNGSNAALAQIAFKPTPAIDLGLTYVRSYDRGGNVNVSGATGSAFANQPFGNVATSADHFGLQGSIRLNPSITLAGWGGLTKANREAGTDAEADVLNWGVSLAFPDLGKKGNLAGIIFGMPPKVTDNDIAGREDDDSSFHLEGLYRYQLNNNISITPGIIVIFNPEHNNNNDTVYVGTIRTTFTF